VNLLSGSHECVISICVARLVQRRSFGSQCIRTCLVSEVLELGTHPEQLRKFGSLWSRLLPSRVLAPQIRRASTCAVCCNAPTQLILGSSQLILGSFVRLASTGPGLRRGWGDASDGSWFHNKKKSPYQHATNKRVAYVFNRSLFGSTFLACMDRATAYPVLSYVVY
jgi:hypothetical protein